MIEYNDKLYHIDVLEVQPSDAISVVETDVEVDFAPPKDYKEPDYAAQAAAQAAAAAAADAGGAVPMATDGAAAPAGDGKNGAAGAPEAAAEEPKFLVFGGAPSLRAQVVHACTSMHGHPAAARCMAWHCAMLTSPSPQVLGCIYDAHVLCRVWQPPGRQGRASAGGNGGASVRARPLGALHGGLVAARVGARGIRQRRRWRRVCISAGVCHRQGGEGCVW